jgi:hypothetical protein
MSDPICVRFVVVGRACQQLANFKNFATKFYHPAGEPFVALNIPITLYVIASS